MNAASDEACTCEKEYGVGEAAQVAGRYLQKM